MPTPLTTLSCVLASSPPVTERSTAWPDIRPYPPSIIQDPPHQPPLSASASAAGLSPPRLPDRCEARRASLNHFITYAHCDRIAFLSAPWLTFMLAIGIL
jgi:hypothetical protein